MFNFNVFSVRRHIRILPDMYQLQLQLHLTDCPSRPFLSFTGSRAVLLVLFTC
jgi:hypothetical protein